MWKKARQILAGCCFVGFAALFVDQSFDGTVAQALSFLAKLELVPQFLAEEWLSLCILLLVTLLLGRIYCSVLCPMGLLQDVLAHTVVRSAQRKKSLAGACYRRNDAPAVIVLPCRQAFPLPSVKILVHAQII